ncbi:MAG: exodeoxyribonuclease VII small subunit [Bacteroidaceae bacterium]|jgi:exodeoxyribonuclease VII small subunit|nr:exodeoxyribonuclease VII small subunit [Bacteroidaceae bacterium]
MDESKLTYEKAVKRLEEIVKQIEGGEMDIDSLAANLKEAKTLVTYCKDKLTKVEAEVKKCLDM